MRYRTTFQCPDTGQTIIVHYAFGRVTLRAVSDDGEELLPETSNYVLLHTNKAVKSLEAANDYIVRVSEDQTYGFEEYS